MKREFLQSIKVNGQGLPEEVVDAILEENSRDIGEAKKKLEGYDGLRRELEAARETVRRLQDREAEAESAREAVSEWEKRYNEAQAQHREELESLAFGHALDTAILHARGRSPKAIAALLDITALRASENPTAAIGQALDDLKKDSPYLFEPAQTPPPYARGTGADARASDTGPATLAGALRERFEERK